jgi:hypothetical protein
MKGRRHPFWVGWMAKAFGAGCARSLWYPQPPFLICRLPLHASLGFTGRSQIVVLLSLASPRHESAAAHVKPVLAAPTKWLANPPEIARSSLRPLVRKPSVRSRTAHPSALDRLPTVSAAEALRRFREAGGRVIPTGIPELDARLTGHALSSYGRGGVVRGQLTEVFGPPGCGKTAFGYLSIRIVSAAVLTIGSASKSPLRLYAKAVRCFG